MLIVVMLMASRQVTIGAALALSLTAAPKIVFAAACDADAPSAIIHLHDYVGVPQPIIVRAEAEASRLYGSVGVKISWVLCDFRPGAQRAPVPSLAAADMIISILCPLMTRREKLPPSALGLAPGTASERGRLAYIFFDRIETLAHTRQRDMSLLLGFVVAHELGHLLLPYNAHSEEGVMRGDWDPNEMALVTSGSLQFTRAQAELIRTRMSRRVAEDDCAADSQPDNQSGR